MIKSSVANLAFGISLQHDDDDEDDGVHGILVGSRTRRILHSSKQQQQQQQKPAAVPAAATTPLPSPFAPQSPPLPPSSSPRRDTASINALSLSFVATAILISLFLLMAIFERFLRPNPSPPPPHPPPSHSASSKASSTPFCDYVPGISVLMPGHDFPTFIAKPSPLPSVSTSTSSTPSSFLAVYTSSSSLNPAGSCISAPCKQIPEQSLPHIHTVDDINSLHDHPSTSTNPPLNNVIGTTSPGIS